jgi:light-regulated signal transduction histidine kinase (bacteriophytochrome)
MEFIVNGVDRMNAMIQSLSAYSGIASGAQVVVPAVELDEILAGALKNLAATISETDAMVSGSDLPVVPGDRHQLMSLFQIFIHNAIKYRSSARPEIRFHARSDGDHWILVVQDNGMGIAPEHHLRVFDVFTRLHGEEIPGTGMGLAIAKRIVELHGGTLWVESRLGEGCRFCFTIARADRA